MNSFKAIISWFNPAAGYQDHTAAHVLFPLPVGLGGKWTKSKTRGLRYRQFNKTTKNGTIIIILIKNMQNQLYTIQLFSLPEIICAASP